MTAIGCAARKNVQVSTEPILNGAPSSLNTVVAIVFGDRICTGTLVGPDVVLTGRHCVASTTGSECVGSGGWRGTEVFATSRLTVYRDDQALANSLGIQVTAIHVTPNSTNAPLCGQDIALIQLAQPLSGVSPMAVAANPPAVGTTMRVVGFGNTAPNTQDSGRRLEILDAMVTETIPSTFQASVTASRGPSDFVITRGPCGGDSGGPAITPQNEIGGVTSRGPLACQYMVIEEITPHFDWLMPIVRDSYARNNMPAPSWLTSTTSNDAGPRDAAVDAAVIRGDRRLRGVCSLGVHRPFDASTILPLIAAIFMRRRRRDKIAST